LNMTIPLIYNLPVRTKLLHSTYSDKSLPHGQLGLRVCECVCDLRSQLWLHATLSLEVLL
jgi:hypothetical protein